jgi:hypothetical protein
VSGRRRSLCLFGWRQQLVEACTVKSCHPPGTHILDAGMGVGTQGGMMIPEQTSNVSEQVSVVSMASDFVDGPLHGSERRSSHSRGSFALDSDQHVSV